MNGTATGKVARNTSRKTPNPPNQSLKSSRARCGGGGSFNARSRSESSSAGSRSDATTGGSASTISIRASSGVVAASTALYVARFRPFSARQPIR